MTYFGQDFFLLVRDLTYFFVLLLKIAAHPAGIFTGAAGSHTKNAKQIVQFTVKKIYLSIEIYSIFQYLALKKDFEKHQHHFYSELQCVTQEAPQNRFSQAKRELTFSNFSTSLS